LELEDLKTHMLFHFSTNHGARIISSLVQLNSSLFIGMLNKESYTNLDVVATAETAEVDLGRTLLLQKIEFPSDVRIFEILN